MCIRDRPCPPRDASRPGRLRDRVPTLRDRVPSVIEIARSGLFYAPPYDRTVEDECHWHLIKYLLPDARVLSQQRLEHDGLVTYIDVLVMLASGHRIALEITDDPEHPDESPRRDALVLATGVVDVLYRVSSAAMLHSLYDVFYLLSRYEPEAFTDRAHGIFDRLAEPEVKHLAAGDLAQGGAEVRYAHSESAVFASAYREDFALRRRLIGTAVVA